MGAQMRKHCGHAFIVFAFALVLIPTPGNAEIKTFTHTVRQPFGDDQSPADARLAAVTEAKREVLEKAGAYLESLAVVRDSGVDEDEFLSLTTGVLNAEIVSQENYHTKDAFGIMVEAKVDVDTSVLERRIGELLGAGSLLDRYKESHEREKALLEKIRQMEAEIQALKAQQVKGSELKGEPPRPQSPETKVAAIAAEPAQPKAPLAKTNDPQAREWEKRSRESAFASKWAEAIRTATVAISLDPGLFYPYIFRAQGYLEKGFTGKAIKDCTTALNNDPTSPLGYSNRALAFGSIGRADDAVIDYEKACELGLDSACAGYESLMGYLPSQKPGKLVQLLTDSVDSIEKEDWPGLIQQTAEILKLDPKNEFAFSRSALAFARQGNTGDALKNANLAIGLNPDSGFAYNVRGYTYELTGRLKEAILEYEISCGLDWPEGCDNYDRLSDWPVSELSAPK